MNLFDMPGMTASLALMQQKMQEPTNWWEAAKQLPRAAMQASLGTNLGGGLMDYFEFANKNMSVGANGFGFRANAKSRPAASPMLQATPSQPIVFGGNR